MLLIPNGRIWIDTEKGAFLGYGRIELLEKIQDFGSIRKAAAEMKMSYQQAWHLVKQMNEHAAEPLVSLQKGGKNGGLTKVTPFGESTIKKFKEYNKAFQEFMASYSAMLDHNSKDL